MQRERRRAQTRSMEVTVGPVAHGGHCVARPPDGPVVFVRHALPGERVRLAVTERRAGFWRADAVEVVEAAPERVAPPCPYARPGLCGGCDFQHAAPAVQRELKAAVVAELLARLGGGPSVEVTVADLGGGPLGWRTRVQYAVGTDGRVGFHPHRSHDVVPVEECPIAHPLVRAAPVTDRRWPGVGAVEVVGSGASGASGEVTVLTRKSRNATPTVVAGPATVRERAAGREWRLAADAFWQVHPAAADTLAATVVDLLQPRRGERAWDLYAGAGLFTGALAPLVRHVTAVESDLRGVAAARESLADLDNVRVLAGDVRRRLPDGAVDLVVLDPPRSGAGRAVVEAVAARGPRAVAYVACDPAAFARDVATFAQAGYALAGLRAFDAFPMTHHVECVGLFEREAEFSSGSCEGL
jgi:tRNA/tmRNA/rRNA uracil-C5-methylase (TrmA/RlmC/RlmD family)